MEELEFAIQLEDYLPGVTIPVTAEEAEMLQCPTTPARRAWEAVCAAVRRAGHEPPAGFLALSKEWVPSKEAS